jgi:hypothetical protein
MNDLDARNLYYAFTLLTSCTEQQNERKVSVQHFDFVQSQTTHLSLRLTPWCTQEISEPFSPEVPMCTLPCAQIQCGFLMDGRLMAASKKKQRIVAVHFVLNQLTAFIYCNI